jgi:hypothetical protein
MNSVVEDIEVIELTVPVNALDAFDADTAQPVAVHLQWAAEMFQAGRVQPARAAVLPGATGDPACARGAAGARTFYWWMLALAMLAFSLH